MQRITEIDDQRIRYYRSLRGTPALHSENKLFIAEGEKVVSKLLSSNIGIISIFALSKYYAKFGEAIKAKEINEDRQLLAGKEVMDSIAGYRLHQGIMAIGKQPAEALPENFGDRIVLLNGIVNSENVGAIARNCAAFGISTLVCDSATSSPYLRRAVRVSMGAIFQLRYYHCKASISSLINKLRQRNYTIISSELSSRSKDISKFKFPGKFCIIFGSEGGGIDEQNLSISDEIVHINIKEAVGSLNVAVASAVILSRMPAIQ